LFRKLSIFVLRFIRILRLTDLMEDNVAREDVDKSMALAAVINAANDTELKDLRKRIVHVWQNSVMGLLALSFIPDQSKAARAALGRLTDKDAWQQ
jgi:hypothetical protein